MNRKKIKHSYYRPWKYRSIFIQILKMNKSILSKNNCVPNITYVCAKNKNRKRGFKIDKKMV